MNAKRIHGWISGAGLAVMLLWTVPVSAQTFSSGSTGALGAFAPAANTVVTLPPDGVLNYTTVTIPSGVTVTFLKNAANTPVTMLATGDVLVNGVISVNGAVGINGSSSATVQAGGAPGPGGFFGGQSGSRGVTNNSASAGYGPGGGAGAVAAVSNAVAPTYGAPASFVALVPLFGGSGGGGGAGTTTFAGASGAGGGGAIVLASSTKITVGGSITADGGTGGQGSAGCVSTGSGGSGGAIRLVAPQITSTGTMTATGGFGGGGCTTFAGSGRIRFEALTTGFINPSTPAASVVTTLGPITAASTPALINLPAVTISSVGGVASPATPTGSYTTADVSLPSGTTNPVPVTVTVNNIPLGTVFTVKLIPQFAAATTVTSSGASGSFASSTATANVTFPNGQISTLNAFASFTLTASLMPLIDGEPAEQVLVGATFGEPSTVTLRTRSGKEITADRLSHEDQVKLARAWEDFSRTR